MRKMIFICVLCFACNIIHAQVFVPYGLQPNIAVENAYNQMMNNMQNYCDHYWDNVTVPATPVPSTPIVVPDNTTTTTTPNSSNRPRTSQHDMCNGTGKCRTCNGTGEMWVGNIKKRCVNCNGSGKCSGCRGTGRTSSHYY